MARSLGGFLRALHCLDSVPLVGAGLPLDEIGRFDFVRTMEKLDERLHHLEKDGLLTDAGRVRTAAEALAPIAARAQALTLVHGDLYGRHILVNDEFELTAIIDWGDVHFGDPAIDLTIAYGVLPPSSRDEFFKAYGSVGEIATRLARYRAIYSSVLIAHYGHRIGDADLVYTGLRGTRLAMQ